jgi:hypothetical protein
VTASAPAPVRNALQSALLLDSDDLASDHQASREVLDWVLSLWSERLVGGEPPRFESPAVIILLGRLTPREGYRVCRMAGLAKLALAGLDEVELTNDRSPAIGARREWLCNRLEAGGPELALLARHDVQASSSAKIPRRRRAAWIGLITVARLLADCEPFRVRWALQHWPYTIAKFVRSLMRPAGKWPVPVLQGESLVLKTAGDRLNLEGRLDPGWVDADPTANGAG